MPILSDAYLRHVFPMLPIHYLHITSYHLFSQVKNSNLVIRVHARVHYTFPHFAGQSTLY